MLNIQNRRYIGNKRKILFAIESEVDSQYKSFVDLFAGTGVVGAFFANKGMDTYVNDTLYSNYIIYQAFLSNSIYREEKITECQKYFNDVNPDQVDDNYFSKYYAGKYYAVKDAKKIGFIRDELEHIKNTLLPREYFILLTMLIYRADKIANTVGHFEHFLKQPPVEKGVNLEKLDLKIINNTHIFQDDANNLVKQIEADVFYIDPPYNARQYVNFYHVLENLASWKKPTEFEGKSMKFKRNELKSGYSKSCAPKLFKDLIENIQGKLIIVSYNNTYAAKSIASNNKIQESEIIEILEKKGSLIIKEFSHNYFNAGKTDLPDHKEKLYICKVNR